MTKSTDSPVTNAAMTKKEGKPAIAAVNELFAKGPDGLRQIVRAVMQEMLEAEMGTVRNLVCGAGMTIRV
jgi:hypothetical protein